MSKMSLVRKVTMIATTFALVLAAFSATSVFAASSTTKATSTQTVDLNLEKNFKAESSALQIEAARWDRALMHGSSTKRDLANYKSFTGFGIVLEKAEAIFKAHAGFDASGKVTDQVQAAKTIRGLSIYLTELRGVLYYRLRNLA